ncbi:hypothetical protein HMPREF1986_00713 [Oribacterium sp. oral taxon 078 str. F0263]|nr:hypothetical protein HMPREF1986_00713 [Oribacterium sp. oral taxon 078 str. F0263]
MQYQKRYNLKLCISSLLILSDFDKELYPRYDDKLTGFVL